MYVQFISIYSKWNAVRCQNEKYIAMLSALCKHSQLRNCSHILKIFLPYKKVMVLNFPYIYKNRVMNNRKCFYICTLFFNFKTRKTRVGYFKITFWIFLLVLHFLLEFLKVICCSLPYFHTYPVTSLFYFSVSQSLDSFQEIKIFFNAGNLKILSFSLHLILTLISKTTNPASYFKNSKCLKYNPFLFKCLFFNPTQKSILKNRTPVLTMKQIYLFHLQFFLSYHGWIQNM